MRATDLLALLCAMAWLPVEGTGAEAKETSPAADLSAEADARFTPPSIRSQRPIDYPMGESREALVYVRVLISPKGVPTQIEVLKDRGFHTPDYVRAAEQFVRSMRYKPAELDGVPVEYGPGDYQGANFHAEWMLREKVKLNYEFAVLQAALAQTHAAAGNEDDALAAVIDATSRTSSESPGFRLRQPAPPNDPSKYLLPKDLVVSLLELRMRLLVRNGDLVAALRTYSELGGLVQIAADDPRARLAEELTLLLESGKALAFEAKVAGEYWSHELFHPRFTVRNLQGRLDLIHLHCRGEYDEQPFESREFWDVPEGWESCVVEFYGEPGAQFELVEMPAP